jgi:hypothetical protein
VEPLSVPHLAAGTFMIQSTGTEVLLVLQSARSLADKNTGAISERTVNQPIAVVSISPGTAKDLHILLGEAVAKHDPKASLAVAASLKSIPSLKALQLCPR